jgi:hypothetical protein
LYSNFKESDSWQDSGDPTQWNSYKELFKYMWWNQRKHKWLSEESTYSRQISDSFFSHMVFWLWIIKTDVRHLSPRQGKGDWRVFIPNCHLTKAR